MLTRRKFVAAFAASLAMLRVAVPGNAQAEKPGAPAKPGPYSDIVDQFRLLHLRHKHAVSQNGERLLINREMITLALSLRDQGVPPDDIREMTHAALARAKADFGSVRDPFGPPSERLGRSSRLS